MDAHEILVNLAKSSRRAHVNTSHEPFVQQFLMLHVHMRTGSASVNWCDERVAGAGDGRAVERDPRQHEH
jgi:hypothetical protein